MSSQTPAQTPAETPEQAVKRLQADNYCLERKLQEAAVRNQELQGQLTTASEQIAQLYADNQQLSADNQQLSTGNQELNQSVTNLQARVSGLEERVTVIEATNEEIIPKLVAEVVRSSDDVKIIMKSCRDMQVNHQLAIGMVATNYPELRGISVKVSRRGPRYFQQETQNPPKQEDVGENNEED